jgi:NitT/TauT family transport system substrate-binding protein
MLTKAVVAAAGILLLTQSTVRAEVSELRMATQFGIRESLDFINKNPRAAAQAYLDASKDPISAVAMITDPGAKFTMAPDNVMTFADFMFKEGLIKTRPNSWKDMFFPEVYDLPGS